MSVPFFCCVLFVTVSVQCFSPVFFFTSVCCIFLPNAACLPGFLSSVFPLLVSVSYFCCMLLLCLSTVSAICFHFASVCSMFLPSVVCHQCLSSVSVICFLFTGVCSMFLPCVSVTVCAQVSALFSVTCICPMFLSCYFCSVLCSLF